MKAAGLSYHAGRCGAVLLLLCTAFPWPASAQIFDPVIGPRVRIISPANHQVFYTPVDIPIFAFVTARDVTNVEFFANAADLGPGFSLGAAARLPWTYQPTFNLSGPTPRLGSVYCLIWTNVPAGAYALTAISTSTNGFQTINRTSPPVNILILSSTAGTNGQVVVDIVAIDPIAIVGTNSWVWPGMTNATPAWTNWPPPRWQNFTNWGPKDALFMVRRFGDASDSTTVTYTIGGTASNGVDYVALPGFVTIPPGKADALIPIVSIDNGPPFLPKTVVLTLTPATNGPPPAYTVGFPSRATALIIHQWPRPLPYVLSDGSFHFNATGPDGAWFFVQRSADLLNWSCVSTNQVFQGSIDYVDSDAAGNAGGFYRAIPLDNPPSQ